MTRGRRPHKHAKEDQVVGEGGRLEHEVLNMQKFSFCNLTALFKSQLAPEKHGRVDAQETLKPQHAFSERKGKSWEERREEKSTRGRQKRRHGAAVIIVVVVVVVVVVLVVPSLLGRAVKGGDYEGHLLSPARQRSPLNFPHVGFAQTEILL